MNRPEQLDKLAGLLNGLSTETSDLLLSRLDDATRRAVSRRLLAESPSEEARFDLLKSFRDFVRDYEIQQITNPRKDTIPSDPNPGIPIEFIYGLDDDSLDQLLQSVPAPATIRMLRCSPMRFVERVLARVSEEDAIEIAEQIEQRQTVDLNEMTQTQNEFLSIVEQLTDEGTLQLSSVYGGPKHAS